MDHVLELATAMQRYAELADAAFGSEPVPSCPGWTVDDLTVRHQPGDVFVFGPETRGLPGEVLESVPPAHRLRLPMRPGNRSLNLSNTVAVVVFEAWRQQGFEGGA